MDELKIVTDFTKNLLSTLITKWIKKKLGYDADINLKELDATVTGEKTKIHLSIDVEIGNDEVERFCKHGI